LHRGRDESPLENAELAALVTHIDENDSCTRHDQITIALTDHFHRSRSRRSSRSGSSPARTVN
jgi:hypothetical protein